MIILPKDGQWLQTNRSDILGSMVGSLNIDVSKVLGKTRVTRMIQTTSETQGASPNAFMTSYPVGFQIYNDGSATRIWTVAGLNVHKSSTAVPNSSFIVDTTSNSPGACDSTLSDILVTTLSGTESLFVTGANRLYKYTAGTWSNVTFTGAGPWMMTSYSNRLYFTVSGISKIYSTSDGSTIATSGTNTLALDTNQTPTVMRSSSNRIWIGTIAKSGKGYVYEWDGVSTQPTRSYRLDSQGVCSMVIKDDVPYIMDTNGRLQTYSNGTFKEVARLPVEDETFLNANNTVNNRYIHPNGMSVINGNIHILINNILDDASGSIPENCPSGVWELNDATGLYHKYSPSYLPVNENSVSDYGQIRVSGVGGLADMKFSNSASNATGEFVAGAVVYKDATTTDSGVFTNDTFNTVTGTYHANEACGHIVTSKILSSQVKDTWQKIVAFFERFKVSTDKITFKYRTYSEDPQEISITWTSTSTFTTTSNILAKEGYEVQIIQGTGSSKTAFITLIDHTSGTYSATLSDSFTGATGTAKAVIQKWTNIGSAESMTEQHFSQPIGADSEYIQLKIAFQFTGKNEFIKLALINKEKENF